MSISPSSDIIVDVMRAAEPEKAAAAARRLESAANAVSPGFAAVLASTEMRSGGSQRASVVTDYSRRPSAFSHAGAGSTKADRVGIEFEALILRSFISQMLPDGSAGVFGGGQAGEMWKSLLSDKIAAEVAKSGRLGIAKRIFAGNANWVAGDAKKAASS